MMEQERDAQVCNSTTHLRSIASQLNVIGIGLYHAGFYDVALEMYQEAFSALNIVEGSMDVDGFEQDGAIKRGAEAIMRGLAFTQTEIECTNFFGEQGRSDDEKSSQATTVDGVESYAIQAQGCAPKTELDLPLYTNTRMLNKPLHFITCTEREGSEECDISVVAYNMALIYHRKRSYEMAEQLLRISLDGVRETTRFHENIPNGSSLLLLHSVLNNLGHTSYLVGLHEDAATFFAESLRHVHEMAMTMSCTVGSTAIQIEEILRDHTIVTTNHALAMLCVGDAFKQRGLIDKAMFVYVKIVGARNRAVADLQRQWGSHARINDSHASFVHSTVFQRMGTILHDRRELQRSAKALECALSLRIQALGKLHEDVASLVHDVGVVQWEAGLVSEAMESLKECLGLRRDLFGKDHVDVAAVLYKIGQLHHELENYSQAMEFYTETLRVERMVLGCDHHDVVVTLINVAQVLHSLRKYDQALSAYREILRLVWRPNEEHHPCIAEVLNAIGVILLGRGQRYDAAVAFAEARRSKYLIARRLRQENENLRSTCRGEEMFEGHLFCHKHAPAA